LKHWTEVSGCRIEFFHSSGDLPHEIVIRRIIMVMPFTPAHIAAVVPLRKREAVVWSALIVGSIAPDFEYFLDLAPGHRMGHSFPGVFTFTLPAALFVLWLFHDVMKRPMVDLMPARLEMRLKPLLRTFRFGGTKRFLQILLSLMIGIATHLLWDSFTHGNTWVTNHIAWLRIGVRAPWLGATTIYNVLQYASSVFGLVVVGYVCAAWYRRAQPVEGVASRLSPSRKLLVWVSMTVVATAGAIARAFTLVGDPSTPSLQQKFIVMLVVIFIALMFWQILLYGVFTSRKSEYSGE